MAIKHTLKYPFNVGELKVEEITLRRPKTRDFIAVGERPFGTAGADAALLASLSGLPENVIEEVDIDDLSIIRFYIARVWDSYFTTKPYVENPIVEGLPAPPAAPLEDPPPTTEAETETAERLSA